MVLRHNASRGVMQIGSESLFKCGDLIEAFAKIFFLISSKRICDKCHRDQVIFQAIQIVTQPSPVAAGEQRIATHRVMIERRGNGAYQQSSVAIGQLDRCPKFGQGIGVAGV